MAATVKSAWAKPGAWALEAEENESELLQQKEEDTAANVEAADFPSLSAVKNKKKKKQTLSLAEFTTYTAAKPSAYQAKGLTPDEMMALPTGPRERTEEELDRSKLGGGFRSYGGGMRDEQPRRQGSFNREANREMSRADETDNWAAGKRSPVGNGFERRERGERGVFFTDSQSRSDEVDNWASKKSFVPSEPRRYERSGGFGLESGNGGADSGSWMKRKDEVGPRMGGAFDSLRERRGGSESNGADSESWGRRREDGNVGSRPRLNLQPRTLPVPVLEVQKTEVAAVEKPMTEVVPTVKPKGSNPFGAARPREEVLKEKGQDWKEIEEKLEAAKIKDVSDGADPRRRNFWSGRERRQEEKTERAWRKPGSADSRPQSSGESVNGNSEKSENGHPEEAGKEDAQI